MELTRTAQIVLLFIAFTRCSVFMTETLETEPLSELCQTCICEATSNCSRTSDCIDGLCGIYRISRPYWEDAGSLESLSYSYRYSSENLTEFESCAFDPRCAQATVENYMIKYAQDCNCDNKINCLDYAAIHHLGAYGCTGLLDEDYAKSIVSCLETAERLRAPKN